MSEAPNRVHGNINKQARFISGQNHYCLVQSNRGVTRFFTGSKQKNNVQIWKRHEQTGQYEYYCDAGPQAEIDPLSIDEKRSLIKSKILAVTDLEETG